MTVGPDAVVTPMGLLLLAAGLLSPVVALVIVAWVASTDQEVQVWKLKPRPKTYIEETKRD